MFHQKTFIHVGMSKTGSTSLQRWYFPQLKGVRYLGKVFSPDVQFAINYLRSTNSAVFEEAYFASCLKEQALDQEARPILISEEAFTPAAVSQLLCIDRLKQVFPNSKIIIVIRNQVDVAASLYSEFYFGDKAYSRSHFLAWLEKTCKSGSTTNLSAYDYNKIVSYIERFYDPKDIGVFLFEDFSNNFPAFAAQLLDFMRIEAEDFGAPPKLFSRRSNLMRMKGVRSAYSRIRNAILPGVGLRRIIGFGLDDVIQFLEQWRSKQRAAVDLSIPPVLAGIVRRYFEPGNRELARRYGIDLDLYRYYGDH